MERSPQTLSLSETILLTRAAAPVLAFLLLAGLGSRAAEPPAGSEYQMKAAFLFNFAQLTEWPESLPNSDRSPVVFGIVGEDSSVEVLRKTLEMARLNGKPVEVKVFGPGKPIGFTHVLFISKTEVRRTPSILRSLAGTSTLTVSERNDQFLDVGGMIHFVNEGRKIRFEINNAAAERAGLKLHSKLLRLASRVEDDQKPAPTAKR